MVACKKEFMSIVFFAGMLTAGSSGAQITPGQVNDTLKPPVELKQPQPPSLEKQKAPVPAASAASGRTITVSNFVFTGNTVYSQEQLAPLLADYLNRPITLLDIYSAADKVSDFYADHGYSLASVNVPPQKIADGVVRLEVSEGVIGRVTVEGNRGYPDERILRYLGDIHAGTLYRGPEIELGLQQLNELPGLSVRAVVKPGDSYGTTDLIIKADETVIAGSVFADNAGSKQIGEFRGGASGTLNNITGIGDQFNLVALHSSGNRLNYGSADYNAPLGYAGTRADLTYGYAKFTVPGSTEGKNQNGKLSVIQPLLRSSSDRVDLSGGFSRTNSDAFIAGNGPLISGTSITLLEIGASYNHTYPNAAVSQVTSTIATNFRKAENAEDARPVGVKASNAKQRLRLEVDVQHLQPLLYGFYTTAHVDGVYTPDPLSNVSQFSIGGPQSVRAFPTSEVRGDRGFFGQLTLARGFDLNPVRLTPRLFVDGGKVYCAATAADCTVQSLSSAGIGIDLALYNHVSTKFDYSIPLDNRLTSDGRDNGRLYGSVSVNF